MTNYSRHDFHGSNKLSHRPRKCSSGQVQTNVTTTRAAAATVAMSKANWEIGTATEYKERERKKKGWLVVLVRKWHRIKAVAI
jgi:hypothetical protein